MNKQSDTVAKDETKISLQERSVTPAVLGIPSVSHGAKLSLNMNSKDKDKLMMNLEAWRKARADRLKASILAKGRQFNASKLTTILPKSRTKLHSNPTAERDSKHDGRKSVFERLYENNGKQTKKIEENRQEKSSGKKFQHLKMVKCSEMKAKIPKIIVTESVVKENTVPSNFDVKSAGKPAMLTVKENEVQSFENLEHTETIKKLEENDSFEKCKDNEYNFDKSDNIQQENSENVNIIHSKKINDSVELFIEPNEKKIKEEDKVVIKHGDAEKDKKDIKQENNFQENHIPQKPKSNLRRSTSMIFHTKSKICTKALHKANSEDSLKLLVNQKDNKFKKFSVQRSKTDLQVNDLVNKDNLKKTNSIKKSVSFVTPENKTLSASNLRNNLENWLIENGHSIEKYRHIRCFGLNSEGTPGTPYPHKQKLDESFANSSFYSTAPNTPMHDIIDESDKENITPPVIAPKVDIKEVEGWLSDLHRLICHLKYPSDRCEEWLFAISRKFSNCKQLPIFWECLAALNGKISDMEFKYENDNEASKENTIDEDLANLFDNITLEEKSHSTCKIDKGLDPKNIFKTKSVMFALHKKAVKQVDPLLGKENRQKVLVATPVRRSTRIQTPDKSNIVGSLKSLDPETRKKVSFQPNEALLTE